MGIADCASEMKDRLTIPWISCPPTVGSLYVFCVLVEHDLADRSKTAFFYS